MEPRLAQSVRRFARMPTPILSKPFLTASSYFLSMLLHAPLLLLYVSECFLMYHSKSVPAFRANWVC